MLNQFQKKYQKDERILIKYFHTKLLSELLYLNYIYSTFKYENITPEDLLRKVIKGTRYNGLEQLEILEEAKLLLKIKYNLIFSKE